MTLEADLIEIISTGINAHERSLQTAIGASELGTPCDRRLGFKLAQVPEINFDTTVAWRPTVGTAVHTWLQVEAMERYNATRRAEVMPDGYCEHEWCEPRTSPKETGHLDRFLCELKIPVGTIAGETIYGTVDCYDRLWKASIDWKIVGNTTLKKAKAGHIDEGYKKQGQTYARGLTQLGHEVEWIVIAFLPSAGDLSDRVFYSEEFDPAIGNATFKRARKIVKNFAEFGPENVLPYLERTSAYCHRCPWFSATVHPDHLHEMCPGADDMLAGKLDDFSDVLPPDHPDRVATTAKNKRSR